MISRRLSLPILAAVALAGTAPASLHADIPWRRQAVTVSAQNRSVAELLRAFAAEQGLPLVLTEQARTTVSGSFDGLTPRQFLDAVCEANELAWFWDGARLHIDSAGEVHSRPLAIAGLAPDRAIAAFQSLGFESGPPTRGTAVRGSQGVLSLIGGPRFLEVADPILRAIETQDKERRAQAEAQTTRDEQAARARENEVQVRVFRLKFATAADLVVNSGSSNTVVPGVARALQNIMNTPTGALSTGVESSERKRTVTGLRGTGLAAIGQPPAAAGADNAAAKPGAARAAAGDESAEKKEALVQADPRLNAIIVRDIAQRMPIYEALIEQLDVSSPVIEIAAAVVDIDATNGRSLGVEFLSFGDGTSTTKGRFGFEADRTYNTSENGNTGAQAVFKDGSDLVRGPGLLSSVLVPVSGYELLARVRALEEKGEAQLVTSPSVITLENVEANLRQEETVFVRVSGREATDLFDVHAGVQLRVTPTVVRDGDQVTFRLVVSVQDGSFSDLVVDGVPSTRQSAINTQAVVPADRTLLIGGYFVERQNNNSRQIPVLGNVPFVGNLFKRTEKNHSRAQRFFFITPRLVDVHKEARASAAVATTTGKPAKSALPPAVTDARKVNDRALELARHGVPAPAAATP